MEEVLDRFLIKIIFAIFVCLILYIYRYIHFIIFPRGVKQVRSPFNLTGNLTNSVHYLSRILGLVILFSYIQFNRYFTLDVSLVNIFLITLVIMVTYLVSISIMELIILYKFNYKDEVLKQSNISYATICSAINLGLAYIISTILIKSNNSVMIFFTLWLFAITILGFAGKLFIFYSKFQFNRAISNKNLGVALSFLFFFLGNTLILVKAFDQPQIEKYSYMLRIFFKCFSSFLFIPFFVIAIRLIFSLKVKKSNSQDILLDSNKSISYGISEGIIYLISAFITSWIVYNINPTGVFSIL